MIIDDCIFVASENELRRRVKSDRRLQTSLFVSSRSFKAFAGGSSRERRRERTQARSFACSLFSCLLQARGLFACFRFASKARAFASRRLLAADCRISACGQCLSRCDRGSLILHYKNCASSDSFCYDERQPIRDRIEAEQNFVSHLRGDFGNFEGQNNERRLKANVARRGASTLSPLKICVPIEQQRNRAPVRVGCSTTPSASIRRRSMAHKQVNMRRGVNEERALARILAPERKAHALVTRRHSLTHTNKFCPAAAAAAIKRAHQERGRARVVAGVIFVEPLAIGLTVSGTKRRTQTQAAMRCAAVAAAATIAAAAVAASGSHSIKRAAAARVFKFVGARAR